MTSSQGQPITTADVTHSNAPDVVLTSTSAMGVFVLESVCFGDEYVLMSEAFEDFTFTANEDTTALQMFPTGLIRYTTYPNPDTRTF